MTSNEIITELRRLRYDRPPTLASIAKASGYSRPIIYNAMRSGRLSKAAEQRIGDVLQRVKKSRG